MQINGMPFLNQEAKFSSSFASPFNANLVGQENVVSITVLPALLDSGNLSTIGDVLVRGAIKRYAPKEICGPESGEMVHKIDFAQVVAERKKAFRFTGEIPDANLGVTLPLNFDFQFDNQEPPSFKDRFYEGPVIQDERLVLNYGLHLLKLLETKNDQQLYREFKPKLDDYNLAYPTFREDDAVTFPAFFREEFFPGGPITNLSVDQIGIRPWCNGRIWEIYAKPDLPFFRTSGLNGQVNEMEIFAANVDQQLKFIR